MPAPGSHAHRPDPRNERILVHLNGELVGRAEAKVSVLDAGFLLGDGVWEGLRVCRGRISFLDRHLDRLEENLKAIALDPGLSRAELVERLRATLLANGMEDCAHVRLMITRGPKSTPYQDPRVSAGAPTVVIVPEFKEPDPAAAERGIRLFTVHVRRGRPDVQDPRWNSHSKLNCIVACLQAAAAGADEALMLDPAGFVATCNSTNFFVVRRGEVRTAPAKHLMPGITRAVVLELCAEHGIPARELEFSLTEVWGADEAFVTGTFAGVIPAVEADGRRIGDGAPGPVTRRLRALHAERAAAEGTRVREGGG